MECLRSDDITLPAKNQIREIDVQIDILRLISSILLSTIHILN